MTLYCVQPIPPRVFLRIPNTVWGRFILRCVRRYANTDRYQIRLYPTRSVWGQAKDGNWNVKLDNPERKQSSHIRLYFDDRFRGQIRRGLVTSLPPKHYPLLAEHA